MQHLIEATRRAVEQKNWYAALALAMTMPDICGRIQTPAMKSEARVRWFFDKYLAANYKAGPTWMPIVSMTGGDFYALRCAFLHQGEFELQDQRARDVLTRFHLTDPKLGGNHNNLSAQTLNPDMTVTNGTLQLTIDQFCEEVCTAIEAWLADAAGDNRIQSEIESLGKIDGY